MGATPAAAGTARGGLGGRLALPVPMPVNSPGCLSGWARPSLGSPALLNPSPPAPVPGPRGLGGHSEDSLGALPLSLLGLLGQPRPCSCLPGLPACCTAPQSCMPPGPRASSPHSTAGPSILTVTPDPMGWIQDKSPPAQHVRWLGQQAPAACQGAQGRKAGSRSPHPSCVPSLLPPVPPQGPGVPTGAGEPLAQLPVWPNGGGSVC